MSGVAGLDIVGLFAESGLRAYGERVTQLSHALQCAALAYRGITGHCTAYEAVGVNTAKR